MCCYIEGSELFWLDVDNPKVKRPTSFIWCMLLAVLASTRTEQGAMMHASFDEIPYDGVQAVIGVDARGARKRSSFPEVAERGRWF